MPWLRYISVLSFAQHNPDIALRLYVNEKPMAQTDHKLTFGELTMLEYDGKNYIDKLKTEPNISIIPVDFEKVGYTNDTTETFKADYMRMLTMSTVGGIWIDSDILFFKPVCESYYNVSESADTCNVLSITIGDAVYHSTGMVMASPERSIFKRAYELLSVSYNKHESQSIASKLLNLVGTSIADISNKYGSCINMADDYIYPLGVKRFDDIFINDVDFETWQTIGLHWYGGAKGSRGCVHGMDEHTWMTYENTLSSAIEKTGLV